MKKEFISVIPETTELPLLHQYLLGSVAPRPIAWASTIDGNGNPNLAPFSYFNIFSTKPPLLIFSPNRSGKTGKNKDTVLNIMETMEVVIHVVPFSLVEQMNLTSFEFPKGQNEILKAGLTPIASDLVKPYRILESPIQMECKVEQVIVLGAKGGSGNLMLCKVLKMHIDSNVLTDQKIDPFKLDLVARMGQDYYCRAFSNSIFEVGKPGAQPCIGIDSLPEFIRNSAVFTGNDLGKIGSLLQFPSSEQIEKFIVEHPLRLQMDLQTLEHTVQSELHAGHLSALDSLIWLLAWQQKSQN